jgi:transcriptional regulator with GAF, ATPase, and Fis domain
VPDFRVGTFPLEHICPASATSSHYRRKDILLLARYFLEHFAQKYTKKNVKSFTRGLHLII